MKVYIKSNTIKPINIQIVVDVYIDNPFVIEASTQDSPLLPITLPDGSVDEKALDDWEMFVQRVGLKFRGIFKIVRIDKSPVEMSLTSRYFGVYGKNEDGTINTEVLLRLRLSDHEYSPDHNEDSEYLYIDNIANSQKDDNLKLRHPNKFGHQDTDVAKIVVQSKQLGLENSYDTYNQALHAVVDLALKIKQEYMVEWYRNDGEPMNDWCEDAE